MPRSSRRWPNGCGRPAIADALPLWTIGHSVRSIEEFLDLLREAKIGMLADVRSSPRSRRHPWFAGHALARRLEAAGIGYRHLPGLGGRRSRRHPDDVSPNGYWREAGFRAYADYATTPAFAAALEDLLLLARRHRTAMMCAEADPARCHRRIVTDHLLARAIAVRHILERGRIVPASMTDAARIAPDGVVTYPPPQRGLFD